MKFSRMILIFTVKIEKHDIFAVKVGERSCILTFLPFFTSTLLVVLEVDPLIHMIHIDPLAAATIISHVDTLLVSKIPRIFDNRQTLCCEQIIKCFTCYDIISTLYPIQYSTPYKDAGYMAHVTLWVHVSVEVLSL